jgi:hypothetical protein
MLCLALIGAAAALPAALPDALPDAALPTASELPHLESRGQATQLIVDGRPFLIIGAELTGTASSSLANMEPIWPRLTRLNINTVLLALGWDWIEPREGKFDFSLVDGLLAGARAHDQHIVFLWFGTWKNGISSFAPGWVKADQSPFSDVALAADRAAYLQLMRHLAQVDGEHTVLMMQMENEVGMRGDSRDRSPAAQAMFARPVPAQLMQYLQSHAAALEPELRARWQAAGLRSSGSWQQVFGPGAETDDIFMAWQYARYLGQIAAAGKKLYALPVFVNTPLGLPGTPPAAHASGSPQYFMLDIWKAGAPAIDLVCPDVYRPNFDEIVAQFHRADNALFVPESQGEATGVANAFYAIGAHSALGFSPFGIDNTAWLLVRSPPVGTPGTTDLEHVPLTQGYAVLRELAPLILQHQAEGTIGAAWLNKDKIAQDVPLGDYVAHVELRRFTRGQALAADLGYALIMRLGPDEFMVAGSDAQVTFLPRVDTDSIAGIADAEIGHVLDGRWVAARKLNGDDILLDYELGKQAALRQSGSGLRFLPGAPSIQRVQLYRYR